MANTGFLKLGLIDVRGQEAADPRTRVDAIQLDGRVIARFTDLRLPPPARLELEAFPQAANLRCEVRPKRYRDCRTDFFTLTDRQELSYDLRVLRIPQQWQASFIAWTQLPSQFEPLKTVLNDSTIKVIQGEALGRYTEDRYDQAGPERTKLAKSSLLNLFTKLTMTTEPVGGLLPWFSFVRQILVIDRQRLYAVVDDAMGEIVARIRENIRGFDHYERADHSLHFQKLQDNLPDYRVFKTKMFSIKTDESLANLQLTMAPARDNEGRDVLLLDADIDEHGDLLNHLIDVILVHPVSGGTHPFDIHEYLLRSNRNLQLGYELV